MSSVVLYTNDMEPITVVQLAQWAWDRLWGGDPVHYLAHEPITYQTPSSATIRCYAVTIRGEVFVRRGKKTMFLFTDDDESALLLKSVFLPGQQARVGEVARREFANGFQAALMGPQF